MMYVIEVHAGHGPRLVSDGNPLDCAAASFGRIAQLLVEAGKAHEQATQEATDDDPGEAVRALSLAYERTVAAALELARLISGYQSSLPVEELVWRHIVAQTERLAAHAMRMRKSYELSGN